MDPVAAAEKVADHALDRGVIGVLAFVCVALAAALIFVFRQYMLAMQALVGKSDTQAKVNAEDAAAQRQLLGMIINRGRTGQRKPTAAAPAVEGE